MSVDERQSLAGPWPNTEDALRAWLGAVRACTKTLSPDAVHVRLTDASFQVDGAAPHSGRAGEQAGRGEAAETSGTVPVVRLHDTERILSAPVRPPSHSQEQFIWPLAAPEQTGLVDGVIDQRSNVYNLGALGYRLLTGREPYSRVPYTALAEAIVRQPLADDADALPLSVAGIIKKATAKRREERYDSLSELETAVALAVGSDGYEGGGLVVGRVEQTTLLRNALAAARAGADRHVAILGEPGVGKSYLWQSLAERHADRGSLGRSALPDSEFWFEFKSSQVGSVPYEAVGSLLNATLTASTPDSQRILNRVEPEVRTVLARISPRAAELIEEDTAISGSAASSDTSVAIEIARIISDLLAARKAAILVFDDLQWLDEQSLSVIHALEKLGAAARLIVLIGRPEARGRIRGDLEIECIELGGLSENASRELIERTAKRYSLGEERTQLELSEAEILRMAHGNPLALLTLAQRAVRMRGPEHNAAHPSTGDSMLVSLAMSRFENIDTDTRQFLGVLSLLPSPGDIESIRQVDLPVLRNDDQWARARAEAVEKMLVSERRDAGPPRLQFSHDTVERAVREEAVGNPLLMHAALDTLCQQARLDNEQAVFAVARLLVPEAGAVGPGAADGLGNARRFVAPEDEQLVLAAAALRSGELLASSFALRYAEAALERYGAAYDAETRLRLHEVAHEAAFMLDDPCAMSQHFCAIRARADVIRVNEARMLWITRQYGKSAFSGALRIGLFTLSELGPQLPWDDDPVAEKRVRRRLRRLRLLQPERHLHRQRPTSDARTALIIRVCVRIMIPAFVMRPFLYPFVIELILDQSRRYGPTPQTGLAFIYWAMIAGSETSRGLVYYRFGRAAQQFATSEAGETLRTTVAIAARLFTEHWGRDYRKTHQELRPLYFEALRVGNVEWATHAAHIYCVGAMHNGSPLAELFGVMEEYRGRIRDLGMLRTVRALGKYQQAVECLLGRTPNAVELTGSIDHEQTEIDAYEREGDHAALVGVYYLRAWLAVYADRSDRAYPDSCRAVYSQVAPTTLVDYPIIVFLWGYAAWREGKVGDGGRALRKLRIWAGEVPVNHEHRYLLVRAEKQRHYRRYRAAERDYRAALARAVEREYIHEAALAAERLGDLLESSGQPSSQPSGQPSGQAAAAFYQAYSLYARWGAVLAAERVRTRLGWAENPTLVSPVLAEKTFVERLVGSESGDTAFRITLDELVRLSAADEGYLRASVGGRIYLYRQRPTKEPEGTVTRIEAPLLPRHISQLFAATGDGDAPENGANSEDENALVLTSSAPAGVAVTVVLANRAQRERVSQVFAARAQSALLLAATVLGLRRMSETAEEQSADLGLARQALVTARENQQRLLAGLRTALLLMDEQAAVLVANPAAEQYLQPAAPSESDALVEEAEVAEVAAVAAVAAVAERRLAAGIEDVVRAALGERSSAETELSWNERVLRIRITPTAAHTVVAIDDVSAERQREYAFEQQRRALIVADRMSSLGMLAAATAHEVGNPNHILQLNLQSLLLTLEHLERDGSGASETVARAKELAGQIGEASVRIEEVVRGIKEYGRSGRGQTHELQNPDDIARRALRFSRILANQHTDIFHYAAPQEPLPQIEVIPGLLEQALINLVKNACEALSERSQAIELRTGLNALGSEVVFSVSDQGRGLPDWVSSGRSQPFLSDKTDAGGSGLGLSIVHSIVEQHGGRIELADAEGFSTVIELHLPVLSSTQASTE